MPADSHKNTDAQAPFESYNGGKGSDGTFQKIINVITEHDVYIEGFLGNGTIYRKKRKAKYSIGIDIDSEVTEKWMLLPGEITILNMDTIKFLEYNLPIIELLASIGIKVFIYLDPPYPVDTRRSSKKLYRHEMTDEDHIQLLKVVRSYTKIANVVISSYPSDLYRAALTDWNTFTFQSKTRNGMATEQVWYNYPIPTVLHDYSYIGDNYRERERIKGIQTRNINKFNRMPEVERNAFIQLLNTLI